MRMDRGTCVESSRSSTHPKVRKEETHVEDHGKDRGQRQDSGARRMALL